jgi:hypothetical protein
MKITKRKIRRIIKEELKNILHEDREPLKDILSHEDPADVVHASHDAWEGGEHGDTEAENLVLPIDHSKAAKSYPVTAAPESLPNADPVLGQESFNRMRIYRGQKDLGRTHRVAPIVLELYYDAMVSGDLTAAAHILEEHLDQRFPGWKDYEWIS